MIKTILVPTDGSDHADKAIDLAADLAGKYDARLIILHALLRHTPESDIRMICTRLSAPQSITSQLDQVEEDMASIAAAGGLPILPSMPAETLTEIASLITDHASSRAKTQGAPNIEIRIVDGAPAETILSTAETEKADMIVMGSRGLGNLAGLLMGSVSHKVSHLSPCTCVTVK